MVKGFEPYPLQLPNNNKQGRSYRGGPLNCGPLYRRAISKVFR